MKLMTSWCKFLKRSFTTQVGNDQKLGRLSSSSAKSTSYSRSRKRPYQCDSDRKTSISISNSRRRNGHGHGNNVKGANNPIVKLKPLRPVKKTRKKKISAALRRSVWEDNVGKYYSGYCTCCKRTEINVFDFQCGHVIAECEGGPTTLDNLKPICVLCNMSSGKEQMFEFAMRNGF